MRSQIVGASPLLSHQQLAHSFLLWRPVQTCKSLCFITVTAPCRHELPHALRKQAGVGRYRMFKDVLEEVSRGGKERKELPQQLGLLSGIMSVEDRKSTRLNSSHQIISYAVFCLKKKKRRSCTEA